jgi:hypothetical protein
MKAGISKQQRRLLGLLATPAPADWPSQQRPAWPVRELRRVFWPNGTSRLSEVKAIEQAEHSTRRAIRALKKRGLVETWDASFQPTVAGHQVLWREARTHVPGRTERMVGVTLTDAGLAELAKEPPA